ncbi:MAG: magnesium transporter [Gemmatimonadetes bacterium]|nr:magnesium transporter [Gemmatimonadota bacterium]MBK8056681.1 magnesium transporter [Gemmatimonadota bacterium]MBK8646994.1 magnesium transporter [Gemmatimonadota bacterium]MBP9106480.1 magnesium transporter [Gemmatimonadaceae bacterium]
MTPSQRNQDSELAALLAPDILVMLEESPGDVAAETEELHPKDLADVAEAMPTDRVAEFLRALPAARAADVLEYLDEELRSELLEAMSTEQAVALVSEMTPDDRADILEELEEETADEILQDLPEAERQETERLLQYDADSAGGLMTTEFVSVSQDLTSEQALVLVRVAARSGRKEAMHAIYVTDDRGSVVGVMSLRELVAAAEDSKVADLAWTEVVKVPATADRAEVARITSEYDLVAVPVVDAFDRIIGVITVDDVIDAIVEEQTEDVQKLGAVQPLEEPYFTAGFWSVARKRVGWLVVLFIGEMFTGTVMRSYEETLAEALALTLFIPLIISSGGNSGAQSSALITRALAVGDVSIRDAMRVLLRELGQGVVLGTCLGTIGLLRALMWGNTPTLSIVVGLTLVAVVLVGSVAGAMLPLVFKRLGFDPAIASSPFVASLVDVTGLVVYFNIARQLLHLR